MANTKQKLTVDTQKHQCIGSQNMKGGTKDLQKRQKHGNMAVSMYLPIMKVKRYGILQSKDLE